MNFARLNHILIPTTRDGRERVRQSLFGKLFAPIGWLYGALSDEGRVLALLILFVGTVGVADDTTQLDALWSPLVGLLVASLFVRRAFHLRGVRVVARAPRRVAVAEVATFELELHREQGGAVYDLRVSRPFLPWDGAWVEPAKAVSKVEAGTTSRAFARARFVARGEHHLDVFSVSRLVPGGLALGPSIESDSVRFLVVPALANVANVDLAKLGVLGAPGERPTPRQGESRELFGVRPYRRGDAVRDLHPRTWARRGEPHVREYRELQALRAAVIVDDDPRVASEESFEAAVSLAAGIVAKLSVADCVLDALVVGGRVFSLGGGRGRAVVDACLDRLATAPRGSHRDSESQTQAFDRWLGGVAAVFVVSTTPDAGRRELLESLRRCRVALRVVRVWDDRPVFGTRERPRPLGEYESVARVTSVLSKQAVAL